VASWAALCVADFDLGMQLLLRCSNRRLRSQGYATRQYRFSSRRGSVSPGVHFERELMTGADSIVLQRLYRSAALSGQNNKALW